LREAAGGSRQALPVRSIHNTASTKSRLFSPHRPGSLAWSRQRSLKRRAISKLQGAASLRWLGVRAHDKAAIGDRACWVEHRYQEWFVSSIWINIATKFIFDHSKPRRSRFSIKTSGEVFDQNKWVRIDLPRSI
jgi:hypothetical protein